MPDIVLIGTKDTKLVKAHPCPPRGPGGGNKLVTDEVIESCIGYSRGSKKILSALPGEAWQGFKQVVKLELSSSR